MSAERNCFNVVNLRGEFVDIGAPYMGSHGQDGAVHITGYNTAKIHMESETKHVAGTQIVQAKDNNSDVIFSTDNENRTLGFDANCTVDFNNCTVQNLAGGGGGGVPPVGDIDFIGNLNCNDVVGGGAKGIITAEKKMVAGLGGIETSGSIDISSNGNLTLNGNGSILQLGSGSITSGSGGIESTGHIKTIGAFDLEIGKDIYFDGVDLYKRTLVAGIPSDTSYVIYKQLAVKTIANTFTAVNTFSDNIVMSGVGKSLTNPGGTIGSDTANIATGITCGTVNCDNGGTNSVAAKLFTTRTSGASSTGWSMSQNTPSVPAEASDKILQFSATEAASFITVASSDYDPSGGGFPSIIIDPVTVANGGRIQCAETIFGTTANRFIIKQDNGGGLDNILQINASTASGEVRFRDNDGQDKMRITKTAIVLGSTIPLSFGAYVFRPVELVFNFTGATLDANPSALFNSLNTNFTRTNDGASVTLNSQGEAVYHLSIDAGSSSGGTVGSSRFMCLFPYMVSANAAGQFVFSGNYCMNITPPGGFTTPVIEGDGTGGPVGSTNYSWAFPSVTGTETYNGTVKITRVNY
jgi:hypothetical protein